MNPRVRRGVALAFLVFLLVQLGALALVPTFFERGYQTVEDPGDPTNSLLYVGAVLVATALMLAAFKFDLDWVVRAVIVLTSGLLAWYVVAAVVPPVTVGGVNVLALGLSALVPIGLWRYPEWYVIDAAGVLMGAGAAGLFGISFGLLPAIVLLTVLAVYDAISVYGTEHMLDLAEGVMDLRIPVVLVIPLEWSYSLLDEDFSGADAVGENGAADGDAGDESVTDAGGEAVADGEAVANGDGPTAEADGVDGARSRVEADDVEGAGSKEEADEAAVERDAFFIGLGDAVIPTVMIASAAFFSSAPSLGVPGLSALNLPALCSMLGTFCGLGVLMWMVTKGRAHAGLPLLNGGAIGGYLLGAVLVGVPLVEAIGLAQFL